MSFIARFLSTLALLGVLVAPVSTIAAENAMTSMEAVVAKANNMMADMGDMPCCPEAKPVKPDCGMDCPLVIICTSSTAMNLSRADWAPAALQWSDLEFDPFPGAALASLAAEPPARPPKV